MLPHTLPSPNTAQCRLPPPFVVHFLNTPVTATSCKKGYRQEKKLLLFSPKRVLLWNLMFYNKISTEKNMRRSFNCHKMFKCSILGCSPIVCPLWSPRPPPRKVNQETALKSTASNCDHRPSFFGWLILRACIMAHVVAGAPQSLRAIAASRLDYAKKGVLLTARGALNKICFKQA